MFARSFALVSLGAFASLALVAAPARAAVMVPLSRAELVSTADLVVRATVGSRMSQWSEDGTQIVTLTELRVRDSLKGNAPQVVVLRQFGGELDGLVERVPGDGVLEAGEEIVAFLRQGDGVVYLTAMAQSVYHVKTGARGEPMVARDLADVSFAVRTADGQMTVVAPRDEAPESLAAFWRSLRALSGGAR